ncbi:hypothetical protein M422DRAFT_225528 [Sphaerobolus stellatus SS14]|nr:hypothetical protein M422DRAFT_225528 [Sphaerobolus stellatus SS14]
MFETADSNTFFAWFKSQGGNVHPAVGITSFPGMGRGAVALEDIKEGTILFTLPRSLTLSMRTSSLPAKFGEKEWKKLKLHKGWVGLILCLLWENSLGEGSQWEPYLKSLPDKFEAPMFWSENELQELEGTAIFDKVGRAEAEQEYHDKLLPAIRSRPDLFPLDRLELDYSLTQYHIMGSRILSRSFNVEKWTGEEGEGDESFDTQGDDSNDMDIDDTQQGANPVEEHEDEDSDSDSDEEDPGDVAMVPLADVLNARYECENAKLCYETDDLQMICTRDITKGDQIWNTYGNPPNSDLLRRYGHVDLISLESGILGNPADIVEIRADLVVEVVKERIKQSDDFFTERIDWWLEEGGDDTYIMENDLKVPDGLVALIRLLTMGDSDWETARAKSKLPKPKSDSTILQIAQIVFEKRIHSYKTSIEEDEVLFREGPQKNGQRRYNAVIVRLGEKRILQGAVQQLEAILSKGPAVASKKRANDRETKRSSNKKSKH